MPRFEEIFSFSVSALVSETADFRLYRGLLQEDGKAVLIKVPAAARPTFEVIRRLENEYEVTRDLDGARVVRPRQLEKQADKIALVLDDDGGRFLLEYLKSGRLEVAKFLEIALGIAEALIEVHRAGLVHKDIKPDHVLIDPLGHVRLTGFGIASRVPRKRQAPEPPEVIVGTLAYMAPEQTGRMNRSVDARSDLYSAGVTFYELLTGGLPFNAVDPMEWVHCHIAQIPVAPLACAPGIPEPLSAIVMKLLSKAAEERYQTASGLAVDLRYCQTEWASHGRIEPFSLGAHDVSEYLVIPEKLYGREREIEVLLAAFDRVMTDGTPELLLVSGYSGIGKSSVVNELHKALVSPHGLFAAGKFDQFKRDIPYATLVQALEELIRQILSKNEAEVAGWRDALQNAVSPNGQLVVGLIPQVELIIGKQPPVPELPPQEAKKRFQMVLERLLGVFAQQEHPLALFLDDLQWLDAATLELLGQLLVEGKLRHLLVIGAYRKNEVDAHHPLLRAIESMRKAGVRVGEIVLAPLALGDVCALIADSFSCEQERVLSLAGLIYEKTGGNPFFTIEFFSVLADEGLLVFDPNTQEWTWDTRRIRAKGFTDNVVDLMVAKLSRLPEETREILKQFSCLGNLVETATLSLVVGKPDKVIDAALVEAVHAGLIFPMNHGYRFLHDRVQEAAYSLIPEAEQAEAHLRIGRLLLAGTAEDDLEDEVFDLVNQFNRAVALILSRQERERVAELNLMAGIRAKKSGAYISALNYLRAGCGLLEDDCWESQPGLTYALEYNRAGCEYLTGEFDSAEERLSLLARHPGDLTEAAAVTCLRIELYVAMLRFDRALEVGLEFLQRTGIRWSSHPTKEDVEHEYERLWTLLGDRPVEDLAMLPEMRDPVVSATIEVLTTMYAPAYATDKNMQCLLAGRMVNLGLEYGTSKSASFAYVLVGTVLGPFFGQYETGFRFGKLGLDLVEARGQERLLPRVYLAFAILLLPWAGHVRTGCALLRRAFAAANEMGDLTYAAYCSDNLVILLLASGEPLSEVHLEAEHGFEFVSKKGFAVTAGVFTGLLLLIRGLRGLPPSSAETLLDEESFPRRMVEDPGMAVAFCSYWIRKAQACFHANDFAGALTAGANAEPLLWTVALVFEIAEYHFYGALARAAHFDLAPVDERSGHLAKLTAHHRQIALWAEHCPANFENREALVAAEIARIDGRDQDAMRLYQKAIESARENGFVHNEAVAYERAAEFYRNRGFALFADTYLRESRSCYERWGADGKVKQLDASYPGLASAAPLQPSASRSEHLDVMTVAKAQQAISSELVVAQLAETLLRIVLENAGAQMGYLRVEPELELIALYRAGSTDGDPLELHHTAPSSPEPAVAKSILNY
ncbi:MAG TPA: serine/threonine-protein kinase PknK, partial [Luteolibacter sp.]